MLGGRDLISLLVVSDLERALSFYRDTLGLTLKGMEPRTAVFDCKGTMLRVTQAEPNPPSYSLVGWVVEDMESSVRTFAKKGIEFERYEGFDQDELGIWTAPDGTKVAWFYDPDGNGLSLTQWPMKSAAK